MNLDQLVQPWLNAREAALARRDGLRSQLADLDGEIATYEKVLKAAGVTLNGSAPKKKEKREQAPPSPEALEKVLNFVNTQTEVTSATAGEATGYTKSYAGRVLSHLRDEEKIRLLRHDPTRADGQGSRPVYAPWPSPPAVT